VKVLQVNVDGWFYGRPKYVYNLSKLLIDNHVDCKIVGGSGLFEAELKKIHVENIRISANWKPLDRSITSILNLYGVIKRENPDLIHSHGRTENIVIGIIGWILKIPVIGTYHTNPFDEYKNEKKTKRKIIRFIYELIYFSYLTKLVFRKFMYITVISNQLKREFIKHGFDENKIKVVRFGVDVVRNDIKHKINRSDELSIIFVGRVSLDKGCDYLLKACKIMVAQGKGFKVFLIGDGDIDYFRYMGIKLGIEARLVFTGFQREFSDFLSKSDIFVLPSRGEGLPISVLEAMAHGLPIIATNVGGIPELIEEGKNGFLVPPGDEISLANAIMKMIELGSKGRYIMGLKNKEKIETQFSSRKMVNSYLHIYEKAISPHSLIQ